MLLIETTQLAAGMVVAADIRRAAAASSEVLVAAGVPLEDSSIERLRREGPAAVFVEHAQLAGLRASAYSEGTHGAYGQLVAALRPFYASAEGRVSVEDYNRLCRLCAGMVSGLVADRRNGAAVLTWLFDGPRPDGAAHAAAVACLSLALALKIESFLVNERRSVGALAACDITNLAVGAALHDIGKTQIPSTFGQSEPLDAPPPRAYLEHVIRGGRMIHDRVSPTARSVVMHHHQRYDGSGFPDMAAVTGRRRRGTLAGRQIHIFSRIVNLADHFENLLNPVDGPPAAPCEAMARLLSPSLAGRFDPYLLWSLSTIVPAVPVASLVALSDGRRAVVARHRGEDPCRPDLLVLDEQLQLAGRLEGKASGPGIARWLDRDLAGSLYPPPAEPTDSTTLQETAAAIGEAMHAAG